MTSTLTIPWGAADWQAVEPLSIVALTPLVVLLADIILPHRARRGIELTLAIVGLAAAAFVLIGSWGHPYSAFGDRKSVV